MAQAFTFSILAATLVFFAIGRPRYDLVALLALLALSAVGLVPGPDVFSGFAHPAVVTVAAVLVISRGLAGSGLIDVIAGGLTIVGTRLVAQVAALTVLVAACSAFMNNVGALALLMPVAIKMARDSGRSPSGYLMPLAFGSLLGGLTTLIGTPPNIIISTYRAQEAGGRAFGMFDFAPVGLGVAILGVAFVSLVGWRLIPERKGQAAADDMFDVESYLTEVRIPEKSRLAGLRLAELDKVTGADVTIVAILRAEASVPAPSARRKLRAGDILTVRGDGESIQSLVEAGGLELAGEASLERSSLGSEGISIVEAVIAPGSPMHDRTAASLRLRTRFGVNLLAVARQGAALRARLATVRFRAGDVVLIQGSSAALPDILQSLGCLPLAPRRLRLGRPGRPLLCLAIFGSAVVASVAGLLAVHVALVAAAAAMVLVGAVRLSEAYDAIDWSVIVLLGAMIPISRALETTGGASLIASAVLGLAASMPPWIAVAVLLVATMFLSDLFNNAAAALLMAPVALNVALGMGVSADPLLMAVAVGASCAFLTPVGHQSNTLVMGPGGYRFGDYWRLGLPLELLIAVSAVPLILWAWPLG